MALVIENGTGKADAESYASVSDFDAYLTRRGLTLSTDTEANKEKLLVLASDYIEGLADKIQGNKSSYQNALQFPRSSVFLYDHYIGSDEIPTQLINAQCQLAYDMESNDAFPVGEGTSVVREKVGPIETEYKNGNYAPTPVFTKFDVLFAPFLRSGGKFSFGRSL